MPPTKKALILSGGGARGAYHVGALKALVELGWMSDDHLPDILAGTSIGAVNAAALASGLSVAELEQRWLRMHTEDVHRLSGDLPIWARPVLGLFLHGILTSEGHKAEEHALFEDEREQGSSNILQRVSKLFNPGPFRSLLETTPLQQTLGEWMDFDRVNSEAAPALLLTATELQSGALEVFCNRTLNDKPATHIDLDHVIASCSIPIMYPWTEIGEGKYWDGAVVANTPLQPVIDLAGDDDVDILVVMMTPWDADPTAMRARTRPMPKDVVQAMTLTLDWAMLASYRVAFAMLQDRNRLAEAAAKLEQIAQATGDAGMRLSGAAVRPISMPTVIAPEKIMPLEWIVDYETDNHERLFAMGYQDAHQALAQRAYR